MIWRVCFSMAIQTQCGLAFFCTKLHNSSASTARQRICTLREAATGCTYECSDAASAADAVQRNLLTQQAFHHHTIFFINYPLGDVHNELTPSVLALVILFAIMNVPILLDLPRPTFRTRGSYAHGHLGSLLAISLFPAGVQEARGAVRGCCVARAVR